MASLPPPDHSRDHESKRVEIITILSVCSVVTTTLVTLRVITRAKLIKAFGLDDWVVAVAQVLAIGSAVTIGVEHYYGLGRHIWVVTDMVMYLKWFYSSILVYNASLVLVKISIVLMYRRIFVGTGMRRATMAALLILIAWGIANVTMLAMICVPAQKLWDPTVEGVCMPLVPAFFAPACINMITDFAIFLMPLPALRMLQLPRKQKIILGFIFCLGLCTCIISIVRLSTLDAAATSSDSTWDNTEAALWSYLELTIAIMAACLPTLRPFMARFFPRFIHSSRAGAGAAAKDSGGSGKGSSGLDRNTPRRYSRVSEGTDAFASDPEIGLQPVSPAVDRGRTTMEGYKAAVAQRGQNETVVASSSAPGPRAGSRSPLRGDSRRGTRESGIRATTVIKQEFQEK